MSKKSCYCGPPGITVGSLFGKVLSPLQGRQWDVLCVYYTHKGRSGLGLLCSHWNFAVSDEILMPAYNCGSEIDPFIHCGLCVVFYRVDQKASIDIEDIMRRITPRTKAIYVTHYFGWPQDIKALSNYCKKHNIYLIEDCALSLLSDPAQHSIGVLGDAAIYSLPKTLPVPDGGLLALPKSHSLMEPPLKLPARKVILRKLLPFVKRAVLRFCDKIGLYPYLPQKLIQRRNRQNQATPKTPAGLPEMPKSYYYDKNIQGMTASAITRYILRRICPEFVVQRRRTNYIMLYETIKDSPLFKPLYSDLPEGVCPLYLPVLVEDRKTACDYLNRKGISVIQWWAGFHRAFDWPEFPEAKYLKEHILAIPVHQQLNQKKIDHISSSLKLTNGSW